MGVVTTAGRPARAGPPAHGSAAPTPAPVAPPPGAGPGADPPVVVWDNANIVESFPELTLPLTFSVAEELYASVYRDACRALGTPRTALEREAKVFEQMLGLLQGRVYYNLNSWYRVLSLLPGFRVTAGYLESMMGAARPGTGREEQAVLTIASARRVELATMTTRLAHRWLWFGADARRFRQRIAGILESYGHGRRVEPRDSSPAALLADFERLRTDALSDWRAPILNDLFLMLSHGALRRCASRWLGPEARNLVNELLVSGGIASAQAGEELVRIANRIRVNPKWRDLVSDCDPESVRQRLMTDPGLAGLAALIDAYLGAWGDRAPRELQLDRPTYNDVPEALIRALRPLVSEGVTANACVAGLATRRVRRQLLEHPLGPLRLAAIRVLLALTRRHIRWREEMRMARGQIFGIGRRILQGLGDTLCDQGILERPDDVHYLTISELRGLVGGLATVDDSSTLIRCRRARYAAYAELPRLPSRLETSGPITDPLRMLTEAGSRVAAPGVRTTSVGTVALMGIGATFGRARGPCLIVLDPTLAEPKAGQIIVARSTDPGWVPVLLGAAGLAVEQGSLLSHSAIVARELGIPTVVGLAGLLDRVQDGDILDVNGSTGVVLLEHVPGASP